VIGPEVRSSEIGNGCRSRTRAICRCFLRRQPLSQLSLPRFLILLLLGFAAAPVVCQQVQEHTNQTTLEVRLTTPSWENGHLKFSVDRINHSSTPLYLPAMGTYISLAVKEEATKTEISHDERWVNIYGLTDLVSWGAAAIAPGATVHNDYDFLHELAVVDLKKETRREIPVRGRLRVEAFYFLSEEDWQMNKHYHEEISSEHTRPWRRPQFLKPEFTTAYVKIPRRAVGCNAECEKSPIVLPDENRLVPDVYSFDKKANARGIAVSAKLAAKSSACSEDTQPTN
jgi:hypothetical protein